MIELNLLPVQFRKKKPNPLLERFPHLTKAPLQFISQFPLRLIGMVGGGAFLGLYTLAVLGILVNQQRLNSLKREWERIKPERERVDQLAKEYAELEAVEKAVQSINDHFSWSRKLQTLSNAMVRGVWLRELSLGERHREMARPEKLLILIGTAASAKGDQTAVVGRFIRSLKENKEFFTDFVNVELESIKRRSIQSLDVMDFKVICTFREGIVE